MKKREELQNSDQKLQQRFKIIFDNLEQGVCFHQVIYRDSKAVDYKILDANPAYEKILEIPVNKAVGSLATEIYNSKNPPYLQIYQEVAETLSVKEIEVHYKPLQKDFKITITSPEKGKFITLFTDITETKRKINKIEEQKRELSASKQQLQAYFEEVIAMNEELEESFEQLESLNFKFKQMVKLISNIDDLETITESDFFSNILKQAFELIPEADQGSVYKYSEGKVKFIDCIGYDLEKLNQKSYPKEVFISNNQSLDIIERENLTELNKKHLSKAQFHILDESLENIKEIMRLDLKINNLRKAGISLDIDRNSFKTFSQESKEIFLLFENVASSFYKLKEYNSLHNNFTRELINTTIKMLEMYDLYTRGHSENVANLAVKIAKKMNLSNTFIEDTYWTGLVHDIGKMLVPLEILNKKTSLSEDEYEVIKDHPVLGSNALKSSDSLKHIAKYVLHHHERWDGSGYPNRLMKEEIPLISRIICVADSWDAMRSKRAYRNALSFDKAYQEIKDNKAKQFDPEVTEFFLEIVSQEIE